VVEVNPSEIEKDTFGYATNMEQQVGKMLDSCRSVEWSMGNF